MASSSSSPVINGRALTEIVELSGETKITKFMKLFIHQHIMEEKAFSNLLHDQVDDVKRRLTKINIMKHEMVVMEDRSLVSEQEYYG
ncbi:hypothetical protein Tco_0430639 [Tanacetum coccineum]